MDKSQERARMGEEHSSDKDTDVTRDQRQQRDGNANDPENTSTSTAAGQEDTTRNDDFSSGTGGNSGSHQEGQYDKQSGKPMTDTEGTPRESK